jgi:hypothetical protein
MGGGENSPSDETGGNSDEDDGTDEQGFRDGTESAGGVNPSLRGVGSALVCVGYAPF